MSSSGRGKTSPSVANDLLDLIVQAEAARSELQLRIEPDPMLIAHGWELRFTGDSRRVREAANLYSELGFEVQAVPVQPSQLNEECESCQLVAALHFQTIYIRRQR
jgi:hypothetical protein